jgi:hypothetical protein
MDSGGVYYTISSAESSHNFINGVLVNGLTKKDNPNGEKSILLSGLEAAHYIAGSETQTMTYGARAQEQLTITVRSVDANTIDAEVLSGKRVLATQKNIFLTDMMQLTAPSDGNIDVKVTAQGAPAKSIFIVGVESNLPPQNCTVGIGDKDNKKNKGVIIGPTVGIGLAVVLGGAGYLLWKYFHPKPSPAGSPSSYELNDAYDGKGTPQVTTTALPPTPPPANWFKEMFKFPDHGPPVAPPPPPQNPPHTHHDKPIDDESGSDWEEVPNDEPIEPNNPPTDPAHKKKYHRIHRIRIYGNNHHHHLPIGLPCYYKECPLALPDHVCDDAGHPCTCVDPKCKLNSRRHWCEDDRAPSHKCKGPKENPNCPLSDPVYKEEKKKEHAELVRKYMAQDAAMSGVKMAATYGIRALAV